jgi:hypothetical protein
LSPGKRFKESGGDHSHQVNAKNVDSWPLLSQWILGLVLRHKGNFKFITSYYNVTITHTLRYTVLVATVKKGFLLTGFRRRNNKFDEGNCVLRISYTDFILVVYQGTPKYFIYDQ